MNSDPCAPLKGMHKMTNIGLLCMLVAAAVGLSANGVEADAPLRGQVWRMAEWSFVAGKDYSAGGGDAVRFDVAFVHDASGRKLVRPAFWDGGSSFKVRFAPTATGTWHWTSSCPDDPALNGLKGGYEVGPYEGNLAVYRHGFVKAEPGKKYFTYDDGTPFFYLGDTHWGMYSEEFDEPGPHAGETGAKSHFKHVVRRRVEQGFTVYQSEPIAARFDVRDGKVDAADIDGFRIADGYYREIADAGLVHANAEFFFSSEMRKEFAADEAAIERLCRYWNARFGAYPVMWTLAQEIDNDFFAEKKQPYNFYSVTNNPWVTVAKYLHRHDAYGHPLSGHQEVTTLTTITGAGVGKKARKRPDRGRSVFADANVAKSVGHNWWAMQWRPALVKPIDHRVTRDYWASERIAVNYEGRYCYLRTKDFGARAQGWLAYLNGFRGYGYGAIDLWLYQSVYDIHTNSHDGYELVTKADKLLFWCKAIEFPSAIQMGYMRKFFERFPWWELEPDLGTGRFYVPSAQAVGSVAAKAPELFVGYFSGRNVLTGRLKGATPDRVYAVNWFNPRTGTMMEPREATATATGELALPKKPDVEDWVYVAQRKN